MKVVEKVKQLPNLVGKWAIHVHHVICPQVQSYKKITDKLTPERSSWESWAKIHEQPYYGRQFCLGMTTWYKFIAMSKRTA